MAMIWGRGGAKTRGQRLARVVLGVGLGLALVTGTCHYVGLQAQADGERYVTTHIKAGMWDPERFQELASTELLRLVAQKDLRRVITKIGKALGPLKKTRAITQTGYTINFRRWEILWTPSYIIEADFENSHATIWIWLVEEGQGWKVLRVQVSSPAIVL